MPSISEPFGITPLEAMRNKCPVVISKQSGVSEVLTHCFKVDFWDTHEIANKIISILSYTPLKNCIAENGCREVQRLTWEEPAKKCINVYNELIQIKN
jgi:glycosyltransferase involved in cell wall biosynthesis